MSTATANPAANPTHEAALTLLRSDEERLRIAIDTAQLGTWQFDFDAGVMEASARCKAHFGRSPNDDFTYDDLLEALHPDENAGQQAELQDAMRTGSAFRTEYRVVWPDGSVHWIVAAGRVLLGDATQSMRLVGVTLDATDRHLAGAAMLQTEKIAAVSRLASAIAHEINNPLEAVTNLLYLARHTREDDARNQYLDDAERELRRASNITSQTLRFHKQSTRPQPVVASDLFVAVATVYQGRLLNAGVAIERRDRATVPVTCFDGEIRQVLNAVVSNAIDAMAAMPSGLPRRLLLRSRAATHWPTGRRGLAITVADTGCGMAPEVKRRLFDPFFTTKGIGGTGLGLWLSREIIDRHSGALHVRSRELRPAHPGGTVVRLFLPYESARS